MRLREIMGFCCTVVSLWSNLVFWWSIWCSNHTHKVCILWWIA